MVFSITTKKETAVALKNDFLRYGKAQYVTVKRFGRFEILRKEINRSKADDLEWARQRNTVDAVDSERPCGELRLP